MDGDRRPFSLPFLFFRNKIKEKENEFNRMVKEGGGGNERSAADDRSDGGEQSGGEERELECSGGAPAWAAVVADTCMV